MKYRQKQAMACFSGYTLDTGTQFQILYNITSGSKWISTIVMYKIMRTPNLENAPILVLIRCKALVVKAAP